VITFISLLRGINVGKKQVKMIALKQLYESLGLDNVRTYVQSGNVIFNSKPENVEELPKVLGKRIEQVFGFSVEVLIRTVEEFQHILKANPFLGKHDVDPSKLHVTLLSKTPSEITLDKIKTFKSDPDEFVIIGREVYLHCPDGYGNTKLSNSFFEKKLGTPATTRKWRTVNMLLEIATDKS